MTPAASPRGRSAAAGHLSIGQVLARLTPEFPELSASKLRYLEEQGLVTPLRTEAGKIVYRLWSGEKADFLEQREGWLSLQNKHLAIAGLDVPAEVPEPAKQRFQDIVARSAK